MKALIEFQKIFDELVLPYIKKQGFEDNFSKPLFYTLQIKSNKFRSATALLSAKLCKGDVEDILPIAATSEIIHNSIIIQDDIADNGMARRGIKTAWKKFGLCHALHASLYVIPHCLRFLTQLKTSSDKITASFLKFYEHLCASQINQVLLRPNKKISYKLFRDIHLGKGAIGRWSITAPALYYQNKKYFAILSKFSDVLGDAGMLKNDVEDIIQEDENCCSDIRNGCLTYPVYYYFSHCSKREKAELLEVYGQNKDFDCSPLRKLLLKTDAIRHCKNKIQKLALEAADLLKALPSSYEKEVLIAWALNHIIK